MKKSPQQKNYLELPNDWKRALVSKTFVSDLTALQSFVEEERKCHEIFPPRAEIFTAFELTSFDQVKVVILGQDPYPTAGHAHGLAFSVKPGVKLPRSLANIYKELHTDLGTPSSSQGYLGTWAKQGVLLLNTVLTVREGEAHSHARKGWEEFTDQVICTLASRPRPLVFLLWGGPAQKKVPLIQAAMTAHNTHHHILTGTHPSPLSAHRGFFGSRPFSKINDQLLKWGEEPIDWRVSS